MQNGKFWSGLEKQLPSYMKSDEVELGWLMAIRYNDSDNTIERLKQLPARVKEVAKSKNLKLNFSIIDARPADSASTL